MVALCNRADHSLYFHPVICYDRPAQQMRTLYFILFLLLFYSSPNLSGRSLNVYHTSTHGVALVRIQNPGLKGAARGSLEMQDAKITKNSPSGYHRTTLSGYIFATKTRIDNRNKFVKQQYLPHMPPQYGELRPIAAVIVSLVWGTPGNFNGFCVLAALLHGTVVMGISQTLRR